MELFDQHSLTLIPQRIRIAVMIALVVATLAAAAAAIWLVLRDANPQLVTMVVSLFQAVAVATALWFFFLVGQKAQSRDDLLKLTGHILEHEIPDSLAAYARIDFEKCRLADAGASNRGHGVAAPMGDSFRIADDHVAGTTRVNYTIARWPLPDAPAGDLALRLHVHLNVRKLDIVYSFPVSDGEQADALAALLQGGSDVSGWTIDAARLEPVAGDGPRRASIVGRLVLKDDFLHDTTERLFVANDLAAMTQYLVYHLVRACGTPAA